MENRFWKVFSLIAFIAFGAVSCWATAESLHLSLPSWPTIMCWIVTIGFFVVASIGTKLIVDSLNQNIYVEKRGAKLIGGAILTIVFWLICSMPTNTHTFFYRSAIDGVVNADITTTKGYLDQLKNNTLNAQQIQDAQNKADIEVKSKLAELELEIKNEANPGFGPKSEEILKELAALLDVPNIKPFSYRSTDVKSRQTLIDMYRDKAYGLLEIRKQNIKTSLITPNAETYKKDASIAWLNLDAVEMAINNGSSSDGTSFDINKAEDIQEVNNRLSKAYATINTYNQFVTFISNEDQERYTASEQVTKVKKVISVLDVWKGFIEGDYKGQGFLYWIIISILVDIAAFIFFDIAFKKSEY